MSRRRRVELTRRAQLDFDQIIAWYRLRLGAKAAKRVSASIRAGLIATAKVTLLSATREDLPAGHYRVVAREHLIIFVLRSDTARVIRIIHGARDLASALNSLDD